MWIEDFNDKQPHVELTIIRNINKHSMYVVGELYGIDEQRFVFKDDKTYPRGEYVKSFI